MRLGTSVGYPMWAEAVGEEKKNEDPDLKADVTERYKGAARIRAGRARLQPPSVRPVIIIVAIACILVVAAVAALIKARSSAAAKHNGPRTATVQRTTFVRTVRLHGVLEATQYYGVTAPRLSGPGMNSLIVTKLARSGTRVKAGDLLVEFDRQQQMRNALDREAEYRDVIQQIEKKKADQAAKLASDQTELAQAQHAVEAAALELRKNEVVSQIDAEKNRQNLEEAKATYDQLKQTFQLKRRAATAEMRILEIQRDRALNAMKYSQANSDRMSVRSPIEGVVVLNSVWKGGQMGDVKEGDEIRSGTPFMQVVNPATMQVRAVANQGDVLQLAQGQRARIGLDAYPDLSLAGTITSVAAEGETTISDAVRKFTVLIAVSGSDPRLMPDLSAAVDVELSRKDSVLTIPRDALMQTAGNYSVLLKEGKSSRTQAVSVGEVNDTDVVIESGLNDGSVVVRNPEGREVRP